MRCKTVRCEADRGRESSILDRRLPAITHNNGTYCCWMRSCARTLRIRHDVRCTHGCQGSSWCGVDRTGPKPLLVRCWRLACVQHGTPISKVRYVTEQRSGQPYAIPPVDVVQTRWSAVLFGHIRQRVPRTRSAGKGLTNEGKISLPRVTIDIRGYLI